MVHKIILALLFLSNVAGAQSVPTYNQFSTTVANQFNLSISVDAATNTSNVTLSGVQTINGVTLADGQLALVMAQTSPINDGFYTVNTGGAWTRWVNFPNGFTVNKNCGILATVRTNTATNTGANYYLFTATSAVVVGTSSQTWLQTPISAATNTAVGGVTISSVSAGGIAAAFGAPATNAFDCVDFTAAGSPSAINPVTVGDDGNLAGSHGGCILADASGHPILNGTGTGPTVTGTGCSLVAGGQDNSGAVVAAGVDTCTITFGGAFTNLPFCVVSGYSAAVLPFISTAATVNAVIVKTAAAGTFSYYCSS